MDIFQAIQKGDLAFIKNKIQQGKDPEKKNYIEQTPLMTACKYGKKDIVVYLLKQGASVFARDINGTTALHEATAYGQEEIALLLIEHGADIKAKNVREYTPLHYAAQSGSVHMVKILISLNADVNNPTKYDRKYPLLLGAYAGSLEIVQCLINAGADIHVTDKSGMNGLEYAAMGKGSGDLIQFFLSKGIKQGEGLHKAAERGNVDIVKIFIETGSDVNAFDHQHKTPLHYAALRGHGNVITLLLAHGADPLARSKGGITPLHSLYENPEKTAHLFFNAGVDINIKDDMGKTPLCYAASRYPDFLLYLLEKGADINIKDNNGNTLLHYAAQAARYDTLLILLTIGSMSGVSGGENNSLSAGIESLGNIRENFPDSAEFLDKKEQDRLMFLQCRVTSLAGSINVLNNKGETPLDMVGYAHHITNTIGEMMNVDRCEELLKIFGALKGHDLAWNRP